MDIDNQWRLTFPHASKKESEKIDNYLRQCCMLCGRHYGKFKFPKEELWKSPKTTDDKQTLYITNSCTDLSMIKLGNDQVRSLLRKLSQKLGKVRTLKEAIKVLEKHRKKVAKLKKEHGILDGIYVSKEEPKKSTSGLKPLDIVELPLNDSSADGASVSTGTLEESSFLSLPGSDPSSSMFSEPFIRKKLESKASSRPKLTRAKSAQEN